MDKDKLKMVGAIAVLGGALALLSVQIVGRRKATARLAGGPVPEAEMDSGMEAMATSPDAVVWTPPAEGVEVAIASNPFLRPATARLPSPGSGEKGSSAARRPFRVTGVRTGTPKTAIINDRILAEGETVSDWVVHRIERNRVTLRSYDGRKIHLAAK